MRLLRVLLLFVIMGLASAVRAEIEPPEQFTKEYADTLRAAVSGGKVKIEKDLELKLTTAGGSESSVFLNNAYDAYKQDPAKKEEVIRRYVGSAAETAATLNATVDRTRIVPVIKDRLWLQATRATMRSKGIEKPPEWIMEDFDQQFVILYAEDSEKSIRYLSPADLKATKLAPGELRTVACENLKRLLPKIEQYRSHGCYVLSAGGSYEASLLLLDSLWKDQVKVKGEIVMAVPARDIFLVAGSEDANGLESLKKMAREYFGERVYPLTSKLFVYRKGKLEEFK